MRYEFLLGSRYIKAQKRQSAFTVISIAAAVAVMTMFVLLYSVIMDCIRTTVNSTASYHLHISDLNEEQGEAFQNIDRVKSVKLAWQENGAVSAYILFDGNIGESTEWLRNAETQIGIKLQEKQCEWNDTLMLADLADNEARMRQLRIFGAFSVFVIFTALSLRLVIDTAFEISSKERERHYGVLRSIGATPEQIVRIILAEALRLSAVGIPAGLLVGVILAYGMYNALLIAGIADLFSSMTSATLYLPFKVSPIMLLISAGAGLVWVFLSAYGVGIRVIKKAPMEAIMTRENNVKKVKKHTLSGLLFGVSGSIAARNARRQKKRFYITVAALTVSITVFAVFGTVASSVEQFIEGIENTISADHDLVVTFKADSGQKRTYKEAAEAMEQSGYFCDINIIITEKCSTAEDDPKSLSVCYVNRTAYERLFGKDAPVNYDELEGSGGYVINTGAKDGYEPQADTGERIAVDISRKTAESGTLGNELLTHDLTVVGKAAAGGSAIEYNGSLYGALSTYDAVREEYFGDSYKDAEWCYCSLLKEEKYQEAMQWIEQNPELVKLEHDTYQTNRILGSVMSALRAGVLFLIILAAAVALINLINIISTGIANRKIELAALQCIGTTPGQLYRIAIIESLQFALTAALISAVISGLILFAEGRLLSALEVGMFSGMPNAKQGEHSLFSGISAGMPFLRVGLGTLTAFVTGCVTSVVMLKRQNRETLSDQIRGTEIGAAPKKTHILRNTAVVIAAFSLLTVAGLRIFSISSYHHDRKEYEKAGYLDLVESNGFKMNVYSTGAKNGKHTIVGLAGLGVNCFPAAAEELNSILGKENTLVYPDRAGCGFSDDSTKKQTLDQVVEDYRTGLKAAGFEAPYVLMAHSYGGYYAAYWQCMYPDEVEAVVFLDGTYLPKNDCWASYMSDETDPAVMRRYLTRSRLGLDRMTQTQKSEEESQLLTAFFTPEQQRMLEITGNRSVTAALVSEMMQDKENTHTLDETLRPTDIPKLYLCTAFTSEKDMQTYYRFMQEHYSATGQTFSSDPDAMARSMWEAEGWSYRNIMNDVEQYAEMIGNCRVQYIPAEHGISYAQKPDEYANSILNFLAETTK